jgi:hypothetical protein
MTDVENLMHVVLCERKVARDHAFEGRICAVQKDRG